MRRPPGRLYEHMLAFTAFAVAWAVMAPRAAANPWILVGFEVGGLALTWFVVTSMIDTESDSRPLVAALVVYLVLGAIPTAALLPIPGIPELGLLRFPAVLLPAVQPPLAFEAAVRAIRSRED